MSAILKEKADFATQGGHWYELDGTPRYTIVGANGKERPTTVRDARKLNLVPSVTTILRQAAAPGLERWKIGNAILSALTLTRREDESDEDYIDRIVRDSNEQAAKARDKGTAIHGAIERLYKRQMPDADLWPQVCAAVDAVSEWTHGFDGFDAERSFASPLGFGGKIDLSYADGAGGGYVVDFKTTDKPLADLKLWPEHRRQLAAYRSGMSVPIARCAIVYVNSINPEARVIEVSEDELQQGWLEFNALLNFWYASNKMERLSW